ncbi:MAG: prohibitin family protein [Kiritimatiellae bacterium]|nr:prohibitin family protein [Kiritimatiellia bacterium]
MSRAPAPNPVLAGIVIVVLLVVAFIWGVWGTVPAGHRGVVLRLGRVTGVVKGEGLYFKVPFLDKVCLMDCRIRKEEVTTECSSKDLQIINATIALNFRLEANRVADVYQNIGMSYLHTVVIPAMQEGVKAAIAQYTAEELVTRREEVRERMRELLSKRLTPNGIYTETLNIMNLSFGVAFNQAIEAKVTAEQNALAAKNILAQRQYEAQQLVAMAKGKAEAMRIEAESLAQNPSILQLRALERWDGHLPRVTSGAIPFIDVNTLSAAEP